MPGPNGLHRHQVTHIFPQYRLGPGKSCLRRQQHPAVIHPVVVYCCHFTLHFTHSGSVIFKNTHTSWPTQSRDHLDLDLDINWWQRHRICFNMTTTICYRICATLCWPKVRQLNICFSMTKKRMKKISFDNWKNYSVLVKSYSVKSHCEGSWMVKQELPRHCQRLLEGNVEWKSDKKQQQKIWDKSTGRATRWHVWSNVNYMMRQIRSLS